eukprot:TRINITY_DN27780_c0_g1_i1.p1 TRINITY_DN27780_c0_g1~~TRINITY_DN27780_c0_g1_i1.p1  ORF type:complete len:208 (+),score=26.29 TRINITY_DN27780_c0_g1_i1:314-937(+)
MLGKSLRCIRVVLLALCLEVAVCSIFNTGVPDHIAAQWECLQGVANVMRIVHGGERLWVRGRGREVTSCGITGVQQELQRDFDLLEAVFVRKWRSLVNTASEECQCDVLSDATPPSACIVPNVLRALHNALPPPSGPAAGSGAPDADSLSSAVQQLDPAARALHSDTGLDPEDMCFLDTDEVAHAVSAHYRHVHSLLLSKLSKGKPV